MTVLARVRDVHAAIIGSRTGKRIGRELFVRCVNPAAHKNGDIHNSLRINESKDVWRCDPCGIGGRSIDLVLHSGRASDKAGALTWLREHRLASEHRSARQIERFLYDDAPTGAEAYVNGCVDRIEPGNNDQPKSFVQCRALPNGEFSRGLGGKKLPLYRRNELLAACAKSQPVFLVEGERKCDALRDALRRAEVKAAVTTVAGGAQARLTQDMAADFAGASAVFILADSDVPGRKAASERANVMLKSNDCAVVRVVDLFAKKADGSDVEDWLANDGGIDELLALAAATRRADLGSETQQTRRKQEPPRLLAIPATDVKVRRTEWFMANRIPWGELTIFEGVGSIGKTSAALHFIACATAGKNLPDGGTLEHPVKALILAEEDGLSMLRARLEVAGADLTLITFAGDVELADGSKVPFEIPTHIGALEELLIGTDASIFYIDALFSHFDSTLNPHRSKDVRTALRPLAELAHKTLRAIWVTRHWNKGTGGADQRGMGSADIGNVARSVLTFAKHPTQYQENGTYAMAAGKVNYAAQTDTLLYRIEAADCTDGEGKVFKVGRLVWSGSDSTTADDLAGEYQPLDERSARAEAREQMVEFLETGEKTAEELEERRKACHVSGTTWQRARRDLRKEGRIKKSGGGTAGPVSWSLIVKLPVARHSSNGDEVFKEATSNASGDATFPHDFCANREGDASLPTDSHLSGVDEEWTRLTNNPQDVELETALNRGGLCEAIDVLNTQVEAGYASRGAAGTARYSRNTPNTRSLCASYAGARAPNAVSRHD